MPSLNLWLEFARSIEVNTGKGKRGVVKIRAVHGAPDPFSSPSPVAKRPPGPEKIPDGVTKESVSSSVALHLANAIAAILSPLEERLNHMQKHVDALEVAIAAIPESGPVADCISRVDALESLVMELAPPSPSEEGADSSPPHPKVAHGKPKKSIAFFGALPGQYRELVAQLPWLDVGRPELNGTPASVDHAFCAASFLSHSDTDKIRKSYPDATLLRTSGVSGWVRDIREKFPPQR